jgi:hypothetical protein
MGNTGSAPNSSTQSESDVETNISTLPYLIDEIAMHYMVTQTAIDLIRLANKDYYDNLIVLTSNVIEKRLNNLEIGYLKNRIIGNNDQIQEIMPANSKVKDKVITDISKFYIKIFTIYSGIVSTFDPQYSYPDENGSNKYKYAVPDNSPINIPRYYENFYINLDILIAKIDKTITNFAKPRKDADKIQNGKFTYCVSGTGQVPSYNSNTSTVGLTCNNGTGLVINESKCRFVYQPGKS